MMVLYPFHFCPEILYHWSSLFPHQRAWPYRPMICGSIQGRIVIVFSISVFLTQKIRNFLTQTVTHMGFELHGTNGANRVKLYPHSQQKRCKSPQWIGKYIRAAAHNPEVGGSSPPPATNKPLKSHDFSGFLHFLLFFVQFIFSSARTGRLPYLLPRAGYGRRFSFWGVPR